MKLGAKSKGDGVFRVEPAQYTVCLSEGVHFEEKSEVRWKKMVLALAFLASWSKGTNPKQKVSDANFFQIG